MKDGHSKKALDDNVVSFWPPLAPLLRDSIAVTLPLSQIPSEQENLRIRLPDRDYKARPNPPDSTVSKIA
jgi:hypothetical protein